MRHLRSKTAATLTTSLALTVLLACGTVQALPGLDRGSPPGGIGGRDTLPDRRPQLRPVNPHAAEEAIAIAERRYEGRAVGAREVGNGVYRVRILKDNGKVKTVTIRP